MTRPPEVEAACEWPNGHANQSRTAKDSIGVLASYAARLEQELETTHQSCEGFIFSLREKDAEIARKDAALREADEVFSEQLVCIGQPGARGYAIRDRIRAARSPLEPSKKHPDACRCNGGDGAIGHDSDCPYKQSKSSGEKPKEPSDGR